MRQFLSPEVLAMKPYTPGEQPRDQQYNKLNTNESPFPPSPKVVEAVSQAQVGMLNLYSDPTCKVLEDAIAKFYGVPFGNYACKCVYAEFLFHYVDAVRLYA